MSASCWARLAESWLWMAVVVVTQFWAAPTMVCAEDRVARPVESVPSAALAAACGLAVPPPCRLLARFCTTLSTSVGVPFAVKFSACGPVTPVVTESPLPSDSWLALAVPA